MINDGRTITTEKIMLETCNEPDLRKRFLRNDELNSDNMDEHGRYRFDNSLEKDIEAPLISRLMVDRGYRFPLPEGKKFALVLTHDIDIIYPSIPRSGLSALRCASKSDFPRAMDYLSWRFKGEGHSPYRCFKRISDIESMFDAHSTFFFMNSAVDSTGAGYDIEDIRTEMGLLIDDGNEIGLHGSYGAFDSVDLIAKEKNGLERAIGKKIQGYRNHFLRFTIPNTWNHLVKNGIAYDSTLGFVEHNGYRNGLAHPYRPIDPNTDNQINLIEMPLCLVDCTLYHYMGLSDSMVEKTALGMLDDVSKISGVLTILWHNTSFSDPRYIHMERVYQKILKKAKETNGWLCSGEEMMEWCRKIGL